MPNEFDSVAFALSLKNSIKLSATNFSNFRKISENPDGSQVYEITWINNSNTYKYQFTTPKSISAMKGTYTSKSALELAFPTGISSEQFAIIDDTNNVYLATYNNGWNYKRLNNKVIFRKGSTSIQYKFDDEGDNAWRDIVPLADIKGDKGDKGDTGVHGADIVGIDVSGKDLVFQVKDYETNKTNSLVLTDGVNKIRGSIILGEYKGTFNPTDAVTIPSNTILSGQWWKTNIKATFNNTPLPSGSIIVASKNTTNAQITDFDIYPNTEGTAKDIIYFREGAETTPVMHDIRLKKYNQYLLTERWNGTYWDTISSIGGSIKTDVFITEEKLTAELPQLIFRDINNFNHEIWSSIGSDDEFSYGDSEKVMWLTSNARDGIKTSYPGESKSTIINNNDMYELDSPTFTYRINSLTDWQIQRINFSLYKLTKARLKIKDLQTGKFIYKTMGDAEYIATGGSELHDELTGMTTGIVTVRLRNELYIKKNRDYELILDCTQCGFKGNVVPYAIAFGVLDMGETVATREWVNTTDPYKAREADGYYYFKGNETVLGSVRIEFSGDVAKITRLSDDGWKIINPNTFNELGIDNFKMVIGENGQLHLDAWDVETSMWVTTFEAGITAKTNNLSLYKGGVYYIEEVGNDGNPYYSKVAGTSTTENSQSYGDPTKTSLIISRSQYFNCLVNPIIGLIANKQLDDTETKVISEYSFIADPVDKTINIEEFRLKTLDPFTDYYMISTNTATGIKNYYNKHLLEYENAFAPTPKQAGDITLKSARAFWVLPNMQYRIDIKFKEPIRVKGKTINGTFVPYLSYTYNSWDREQILTKSVVENMVKRIKDEDNLWLNGEPNKSGSVTLRVNPNTDIIDIRKLTDDDGNSIRAIVEDVSLKDFPSLNDTLSSLVAGKVAKGNIDATVSPFATLKDARAGWYWHIIGSQSTVWDNKLLEVNGKLVCQDNVEGIPINLSKFYVEPAPIIAEMVGATATTDGTSGLPAKPKAGDEKKFHTGANTYEEPPEMIPATLSNNGVKGYVPTPPSGEWVVLQNYGWGSIPLYIGATLTSFGFAGLQNPANPSERDYASCGDGTYKAVGLINGTNNWAGSNTFLDSSFRLADSTTPTKKVEFELSNVSANSTTVLTVPVSGGVIATLGDITKAKVGLSNVTDNAQVKKINSSVSGNVVIWNATTGDTVADSGKALPVGNIIGHSDTQTLTNKTLSDMTTKFIYSADATKIFKFDASGITSGSPRTYTAPNKDGTLALTSDLVHNKMGYDLTVNAYPKAVYRDKMLTSGFANTTISASNVPWVFNNVDQAEASLM